MIVGLGIRLKSMSVRFWRWTSLRLPCIFNNELTISPENGSASVIFTLHEPENGYTGGIFILRDPENDSRSVRMELR